MLNTQSLGVEHLEALSRLTKQFILTVQLSRQPSKRPMKDEKNSRLPGAEHRDDLEALTWKFEPSSASVATLQRIVLLAQKFAFADWTVQWIHGSCRELCKQITGTCPRVSLTLRAEN